MRSVREKVALVLCAHTIVLIAAVPDQKQLPQPSRFATFFYKDPSQGPREGSIYGEFQVKSGGDVQSDRENFKREIDNRNYADPPRKIVNNVFNEDYLKQLRQSNRANLITKPLSSKDEVASGDVVVESNILHLVRPRARYIREKSLAESDTRSSVPLPRAGEEIEPKQRRARGWNLENVIVPNKYPYVAYMYPYQRRRQRG